MEIPDSLLKEALDRGWVAMALHERTKIDGLCMEIQAFEKKVLELSATIDTLMNGPLVEHIDLVIQHLESKGYNERLLGQRKEIRGLHKKIARLEEELNEQRLSREE